MDIVETTLLINLASMISVVAFMTMLLLIFEQKKKTTLNYVLLGLFFLAILAVVLVWYTFFRPLPFWLYFWE